MKESQEQVIQANGLNFALKLWQSTDGVPTLALHGWLDNAGSFDAIAPLLDTPLFCAADLAGHGLSEHRPQGAHYYITDYAADALAIADALQWREFNLIGHSLGANIALVMAGISPERIKKLVLIEGFGPHGRDAEAAVSQMRSAFAKMKTYNPNKQPAYPDWDTMVEKRMHGGTPVSRQAAEILCKRGVKSVSGGWSWRSDPRLRYPSPLRLTEAEVQALIANISAPTCLILGDKGLPLEFMEVESRREKLVNLHMATLRGGHHLHLEEGAEQVAATINTFLVTK